MTFQELRSYGNIGENKIAQWFMCKHGAVILPIYDTEIETGKGAKVYSATRRYVSPDLLVMRNNTIYWIEAKHKGVFSWHRISQKWVTGIDLHHYQEYRALSELVPGEVLILFLHQNAYSDKRNEPYPCPTGLFGGALDYLVENENHRHDNWGKTGMVYWAHDKLKRFAFLEDMI